MGQIRRIALFILLAVMAGADVPASRAAVYDLSRDFSPTNNPAGAWTHGWKETLDGSFTALAVQHVSGVDNGTVPSWQLTSSQGPAVYKNVETNTLTAGSGLVAFPAGTVWFIPGENGRSENFGVVRFTAPSNGSYRIETSVAPVYTGPPQGDTDFHVLKNGSELFGQSLAPSDTASFSNTVVMAAGDIIDFAIGRGADGSSVGSGLRIHAGLTLLPPPPGGVLEIPVVNHSFENPVLEDGQETVNNIPGWTGMGTFFHVRNPTDDWFPGTSQNSSGPSRIDGFNIAGINNDTRLYQDVAAVFLPEHTYTLTVLMGTRNSVPFGIPKVRLISAGTTVAELLPGAPADGTFERVALTYVSPSSGGVIGTPIRIEFQGLGGDAQFWIDDVRLSARPPNIVTNPPQPGVFDLSDGFSPGNNPNPPWAYGWAGSLGGAFTALTVPHVSTADGGVQVPSWQLTSYQTPAVYKNTAGETISVGNGLASYPAGTVWYYPGENGRAENFGVIRFTAPSNGAYRIETAVAPVYNGPPQGDTDFHVLKNGVELFGRSLAPSDTASFSGTVTLSAGGTIDFAIGRGADGSQFGSGLQIQARLTPVDSLPPGDECIPPVSGLVAWWPLEGNAADLKGDNDGTLAGSPVFGGARVGQGMNFDGGNDLVRIPAASELNVGAGGGLTVEGWINPANLSHLRPLVEWNSGAIGAHFWTGIQSTGDLSANLVDSSGVSHPIRTSAGLLSTGVWQHVALTYDKASGQAAIYHNGTMATQANLGTFTPLTTGDLYFGNRPSGPFSGIFWAGGMDEISLYGRALAATEIAAIHQAGSAGKCVVPPEPEPTNCPVPVGLVSWWRAEGNADDSAGNNHGQLRNGAGFAPGMVGQGFLLDGVNDYVLVPDSSSLDLTNEISIELWFRSDEWAAGDTLIDKRTFNDCNYGAIFSNDRGLTVYFADRAQGWHTSEYFPLPSIGVFHHFATTLVQADAGHVSVKTYLDGALVKEQTFAGSLADAVNNAPVSIGTERDGAADFFKGVIDEVSIYNRALAGSEINSIFRAGAAGKCAPTNLPPVNHPPVARIVLGPVFELWGDETNLLVVAGNGQNAVLELDGSLSSDPDGDALDYLWIEEGQPAPFAAGVLAINSFELGSHTILLVADDGRATGSDAVSIDVITLGAAVEELILFVTETDLGRKDKRPLLATLNRVLESFEAGHLNAGVKQLGAFQMKIRAHLLKVRPAAGRRLIAAVDQLVDAAMSAMDDSDDPKRGRGAQ